MNILCELFGHKVSLVALIMCDIKASDLTRGKPNIIECERCGWTLDLNNKEAVDTFAQHIQERNFCKTLWDMIIGKNSVRA